MVPVFVVHTLLIDVINPYIVVTDSSSAHGCCCAIVILQLIKCSFFLCAGTVSSRGDGDNRHTSNSPVLYKTKKLQGNWILYRRRGLGGLGLDPDWICCGNVWILALV